MKNLRLPLADVHIIKGSPIETDYSTTPPSKIDNWAKAQAVQYEPFIYIMSNGSPWVESSLDDLFRCLDQYSLDPERSYETVDPCEGVRDPESNGWETKWIDGPRLYTCDGVVRFSGNFIEYSHVFEIDTNYQSLIDILREKIAASLNRPVRHVMEEDRNERQRIDASSAASVLGKRGGLVKSEAKSTSSRENGRKGGRPRNQQSLDMEEI